MNEDKRLAVILMRKRYERGVTQEKLAEMIDITTRYYQKLESGESLPGFKTVCKLAKELEINFADFAEEEAL